MKLKEETEIWNSEKPCSNVCVHSVQQRITKAKQGRNQTSVPVFCVFGRHEASATIAQEGEGVLKATTTRNCGQLWGSPHDIMNTILTLLECRSCKLETAGEVASF